jgi:hypothetical protein
VVEALCEQAKLYSLYLRQPDIAVAKLSIAVRYAEEQQLPRLCSTWRPARGSAAGRVGGGTLTGL